MVEPVNITCDVHLEQFATYCGLLLRNPKMIGTLAFHAYYSGAEGSRMQINRREMLGLFGAGVLSVRRLSPQGQFPQFRGLDHIEFYVSDVERSRDFFMRIF